MKKGVASNRPHPLQTSLTPMPAAIVSCLLDAQSAHPQANVLLFKTKSELRK